MCIEQVCRILFAGMCEEGQVYVVIIVSTSGVKVLQPSIFLCCKNNSLLHVGIGKEVALYLFS